MADYDLISSTLRSGIAIDEIEFAIAGSSSATGYLLGRRHNDPQPLVIALHHERGDKATLLPDLEYLIGRGFLCLSIDSPITRRASADRDPLAAFNSQFAIAVAALDLFRTDPGVNNNQVALIGRGLGGEVAGTVAARTGDVQVVTAIAALPDRGSFVEHSDHPLAAGIRLFHSAEQVAHQVCELRSCRLVAQLEQAAGTHWLLQVADDDDRFSDEDRATMSLSIPRSVRVEHFAHSSDLVALQAQRSRVDFISKMSGL